MVKPSDQTFSILTPGNGKNKLTVSLIDVLHFYGTSISSGDLKMADTMSLAVTVSQMSHFHLRQLGLVVKMGSLIFFHCFSTDLIKT